MAVIFSSLRPGRRFNPQKYFSASGTYLCQKLTTPLGNEKLEGLGKLRNELTSSCWYPKLSP
jgi:hypothetical protein